MQRLKGDENLLQNHDHRMAIKEVQNLNTSGVWNSLIDVLKTMLYNTIS